MNLPTIIVMIAFAAGLAVAVLVSGGIMPDNFTPLETDNQISYWVGYKVGELCGLPLVSALIATVATAYKAGLRRSMLNALGAVAGTIIVAAITTYSALTAAAARPQLPFAEASTKRTAFINGAISSCTEKQRAAPQNAAISAATIETYCSCFGNALADVITWTEVASIGKHQAPGPGYVEKTNAASLKCSQLVRGQK